MTKLLTFFLAFFIVTVSAYGQPPVPKNVSSIYKQLEKCRTDTGRVNLLIKIARYDNANSGQHPALLDSAFAVTSRALSLSNKISYNEGIGLSYQLMAQTWCNKKDFKKSDLLIRKAIDLFIANNLFRDAAEAYLNTEEFYQAAGGNDFKVRIGYYEQARALFNKAGALEREAATLERLGDFYQVLKNFDQSLTDLQQALTIYKSVHYPNLQFVYDLLGTVNMQKSRYQEALRYGLLAEKTAIAVKDTSLLLCTIYCRVGSTYFLLNNVEQANIYFKKALTIAERYQDASSIRISMQSLFAVLSNQHKYPEALALLNKTVKKFPSTEPEARLMDYANFIRVYSGMKNYKMAEQYTDSLMKGGVVTHVSSTTVYALCEMVEYFVRSRQFVRAARYTNIVKEGAVRFSMKRNQYKVYLFMFKIDSAQKKYLSAIDNYRHYNFIKDSLYDLAKTRQVDELKISYETEKKEQNIAALEKNNAIQKESVKRADGIRNITIAGSLILLVLLALLYHSFRINKLNSVAIDHKNQALNQLVTEKEWLLKEIHHRVKNNLQIVTGLLQRQSAYIDNGEALAAIQNSENRMHAIAMIHQKLYQSENLDLISMSEYIEEMISFLTESCGLGSRIRFEKHLEDIKLDVAQAVPLGLILNEAITNAVKYAYGPQETGIIYLTLIKNEDGLNQLIIADDGLGLPDSFIMEKVDSLGINLMRGLSKQLGASLEFSNEQGCTITIIFKTEFFSKTANRG